MQTTVPQPERLHSLLERFGLSGYESRVLLGLLRLGSASASQLGRISGVARQNVYTVLRSLTSRGLAEPIVGDTSRWASPGRDEVLQRLFAAEESRLRGLRAGMDEAQRLLAELGPETPEGALPYVRIIPTSARTSATYMDLLGRVRDEVLVFNRGPYDGSFGEPKAAVLAALARGVRARALYQESELRDPGMEAFRLENEAYHRAGARGRVVDELPLRMAVFDHRSALIALPDPVLPSGGFPTNLVVDHPGFAVALGATFEQYWERSRPYGEPDEER